MSDSTAQHAVRHDLDRAAALIRDLQALRTEEPEVPPVRDRLFARGMDLGLSIAVAVGLMLLAWVPSVLLAPTGNEADLAPDRLTTGQIVALATPIPLWIAFVLLNEGGRFGHGRQTIGKRLMGLQLVSTGGEPVSARRALARAGVAMLMAAVAGLAVLVATLFVPPLVATFSATATVAVVAIVVAGRNGRAFHDRICSTRLIRPR
jgi:uncharacterized RDD family membrane protein YckC